MDVIPITIRYGDTLYDLFGPQWRSLYDSDLNKEFRKINPNPMHIEQGTVFYVDAADYKHPVMAVEEHFGSGEKLVGVDFNSLLGHNAEYLLSTFPELTLYMVHPLVEWDLMLRDLNSLDFTLKSAEKRTGFASSRRTILTGLVDDLVDMVPDELDFVFLAGDNFFPFCYTGTDLEYWYPKVRVGGWIFGQKSFHGRSRQVARQFALNHGSSFAINDNYVWSFQKSLADIDVCAA